MWQKKIKKNCQLWWFYKKSLKEHNPNWHQIPDHPCSILITGGSRSKKTNASGT